MKLTYYTWVVEDVLPDDLFYYRFVDVQAFLESKKSFLASFEIDNQLYASFLHQVCLEYDINPKIFLCLLQREQGLVTTKTLPPTKKLSRALGFGMTDAGDIEKYYGFVTQHTSTAEWLAENFKTYKEYKIQPRRQVDGGLLLLRPLNAMTSVMYKYTPWTGDPSSHFTLKWGGIHGVYLFWRLWRQYWKDDLTSYYHIGVKNNDMV